MTYIYAVIIQSHYLSNNEIKFWHFLWDTDYEMTQNDVARWKIKPKEGYQLRPMEQFIDYSITQ